MYLEKLSLQNYRNISHLEISFSPGITILYGENGQGKSNMVESIYLLAKASSFRTNYSKELIQWEYDQTSIDGLIQFNKFKKQHKIILSKSGKSCFINEAPVHKFSEYVGDMLAICFSPEDVSLFKDSPGDRRRFLDKELSSMFPLYIKQLILFKGVLEQRNNLLKSKFATDKALLEVLDDKLLDSSYDIYKRRKWLLDKIAEFATKIYQEITAKEDVIHLTYKTYLDEKDKEQYIQKGKEILHSNLNRDMERMLTNVGIHKDDFVVFLNDMQIDMYASQGQQRLLSLVMKLAVAEIVFKASKEEPILILDDAFSELDTFKKQRLFNYIAKKQQVFITCTDYRSIISKDKTKQINTFYIQNGTVVERKVI